MLHIRYRNSSRHQQQWSNSAAATEYLPETGRPIAHFQCRCSSPYAHYRGTLSQLLSDSLSTVPPMQLDNATIYVELDRCAKIKLVLDVTDMLFQHRCQKHYQYI